MNFRLLNTIVFCIVILCYSCKERFDNLDKLPTLIEKPKVVPINYNGGYTHSQFDGSELPILVGQLSDTLLCGQIYSIEKKVVQQADIVNPESERLYPFLEIKANPNSKIIKKELQVEKIDMDIFETLRIGEDTTSMKLLNSTGVEVLTNTPIIINKEPTVPLFPQPVEVLPGKKKDLAYYDNMYWDMDQGLSSAHIFKIFQDSRKHIWLGTRDGGAIRYDGNSFTKFGIDEGLTDGLVSDIMEDDYGNIWFTTGNGVYIFDGDGFAQFSEEEGIATLTCMAIDKGKYGEMWITTFGGGLIRMKLENGDINSVELTNYSFQEGLIANELWPVKVDKNGDVWFGYYRHGLCKISLNGKGEFVSITNFKNAGGQLSNVIFDIIEMQDDRLAFSTNHGIVILQENRGKDKIRIQYIDDQLGFGPLATRTIFEDTVSNILWGGCARGLLKIRLETDSVAAQFITMDDGLSDNDVRSFCMDDERNLWIGTKSSGLNRFRLGGFQHLREAEEMSFQNIHTINENSKGDICVQSKSGLLVFEDGQYLNDPITKFYGDGQGGSFAGSISYAEAEDGVKYIGGFKGMFRVENDQTERFLEANGIIGHDIRDILVHSNGKIYCSTYRSGFSELEYRSRNDYTFSSLSAENGLPGNLFNEIEEDNYGGIWICSDQGTSIYYPTNSGQDSIIHFTSSEGMSSSYTTTLFKDSDGNMWIGTENGLNYVILDEGGKPENIEYYTTSSGLAHNKIRAITEDQDHRIWVGTNEGLSVISDFKTDPIVYTLDKKDGLISVDFSNNALHVDQNNQLWIGTNHALSILDLNAFELNTTPPDPSINYLTISDTTYHFHERDELPVGCTFEKVEKFKNLPADLSLPYYMNHVKIHFSATEWKSPTRIRHSYRIKEMNEPWSTPSNQNFADYRGLNPGYYTFELISSGATNEWSDPVTYSFEIRPPWWLTLKAKIAYFLLIVLSVFGIIRWRTLALRRRQRELEIDIENATVEIRKSKDEILLQKEEIEAHHKEVKDSIMYAKRIQSAILPPTKLVKSHLKDSFILYAPKDVVAGDFYWLEEVKGEVLFAAADCTGHGVPGAMVSVICNGGLNRSVREYGLINPGEILDKTREIVIEEFAKSEEEVKDGMDIALCSIKGKKLKYAGANNPLWIIQKDGTEVIQIKAEKQPIGKYAQEHPFKTHEIDVNEGDTIYLFSDGYQDQFGGEKGKKFKTANLKRLLLSIQNQSMEKQKELLIKAFEDWKGELEQVDDVCVIGVRI
jgi:ligand-binding sensor domain-containing protein/serine phosphatase RsbU (regulator of sigma subunit)